MPAVTITLEDTPAGGVSVRTDFCPAVGRPISPAQSAALDIIRRLSREHGLPQQQDKIERLVSEAKLAQQLEAVSVVQVEGGQS